MVIPIPARRAHPRGRPPLVGLKMQSDANTEMISRVNCFSSLLNFNSNESERRRTSLNIDSLIGKSLSLTLYKKRTVFIKKAQNCDSRYLGCTSQRLQDRIKQNIPKSTRNATSCYQTRSQPKRHCKSSTQQVPSIQSLSCDSAIGLHLLRNSICAQNYDDKQFSILPKAALPFIYLS